MKITITAVPKPLTRLFPNTWVIADDENCLYYIEKMKEFIFGRETLRIAYNMGLDIFTLVFIKDAPFKEVYYKKVEMLPENKRDVVLHAVLNHHTMGGDEYILVSSEGNCCPHIVFFPSCDLDKCGAVEVNSSVGIISTVGRFSTTLIATVNHCHYLFRFFVSVL